MSSTEAEISAMTALADALGELDDEARVRVLTWAASRFTQQGPVESTLTRKSEFETGDDHGGTSNSYQHFADLFDSVNPSSASERLLTGAYWIQVVQGHHSFRSRAVNDLLKDVGHGLDSNVANTFTRMQQQSPALVRQISKSGRTQQARKNYKLTTAGIAELEARL